MAAINVWRLMKIKQKYEGPKEQPQPTTPVKQYLATPFSTPQ
jgi:hypothetical protein